MLLSLPSMPGVTKGTTPVHRPVNMNCQAVLGTLIQRPSRWVVYRALVAQGVLPGHIGRGRFPT